MKDFKKSYKGFARAQNGNAVMVALTVTAIFGAGFIGYKVGQEDIFEQFMANLSQQDTTDIASQELSEVNTGKENPVLAKVDGQEIRRLEVMELVNSMPSQMRQIPLAQLYPMLLEQAIANKIVDSKAANSGLDKDKDVQKQLLNAKQQIIRAKFLENEIKSRVGEDRIRAKYNEYLKNFPKVDEVRAAHILVDDEKLARDIIKKLDNGADFATLAKEYSKDGSAQNGGDLGFFVKEDVVPEFAKAAFETKPGTYAKQPIKSDFGFHVLKIEERRQRAPEKFEKMARFIEQELHRAAFDEIMKEWESAAKIERFDINGNPLPNANANDQDQATASLGEKEARNAEPAAGEVIVEEDSKSSEDKAPKDNSSKVDKKAE